MSEQLNWDYTVGLFDGKILSMSFYNKSDELFKVLFETIQVNPVISTISGSKVYEWDLDTIKIKCWVKTNGNSVSYLIVNKIISIEYKSFKDTLLGDNMFE